MSVINVMGITKDYGGGKGVFDATFSVNKGEIFGFLGPNGAGKTTTIRQLMGFIKPDKGSVTILSMNCFEDAHKIAKSLGYLPGEIAFMDDMTGIEFIRFVAQMKKVSSFHRAQELMDMFELDPSTKINKMSKGTKQKIAIVCAFMNDPDILVLDEPTSGLDPLMQNKFVELVLKQKERGSTILMSSHIFEEVEKTCDRVAIIRQGKIVAIEDIEKLKHRKHKIIDVSFASSTDAMAFADEMTGAAVNGDSVAVKITGNIDEFIKTLSKYTVKDLSVRTQSLEELFMHFYGGEN